LAGMVQATSARTAEAMCRWYLMAAFLNFGIKKAAFRPPLTLCERS
jgi:hypothetical protein